MSLLISDSGVFAAPFVKEEEAKKFIRLKRQAGGYWDPYDSRNQWGYTIQEQVTQGGVGEESVSLSMIYTQRLQRGILMLTHLSPVRQTSTGQPYEQTLSTTWT